MNCFLDRECPVGETQLHRETSNGRMFLEYVICSLKVIDIMQDDGREF